MSELTVPPEAVGGSARAWVSVTGDILAPALDNPGGLVRLPTGRQWTGGPPALPSLHAGCGEQNMVGLVPNIYLLDYLAATGQSQPELERKAKQYMEVGYSRQQKYRHPDGAYRYCGYSIMFSGCIL